MNDGLTLDEGLPANVEAERTILGAVLLDNVAHIEAAESLSADDFWLDSHRRIFLRMDGLFREGHAVDIVTLSHALAKHKEVESVGGIAYLASLTEGLPRRPMIGEYIRIVKDKSLLRRLMLICSSAIARAADQSETALEVLGRLELDIEGMESKSLGGADLSRLSAHNFRHVLEGVQRIINEKGLEANHDRGN